MPKCCVCKGSKHAQIRFPQNSDRRALWLTALQLPSLSSESLRLCRDHFSDKDFYKSRDGRDILYKSAIPTLLFDDILSLNSRILSEHSYSSAGVSSQSVLYNLLLTITCLMSCLVPALIFVFYCWEDETDPLTEPERKRPESKFRPVTLSPGM